MPGSAAAAGNHPPVTLAPLRRPRSLRPADYVTQRNSRRHFHNSRCMMKVSNWAPSKLLAMLEITIVLPCELELSHFFLSPPHTTLPIASPPGAGSAAILVLCAALTLVPLSQNTKILITRHIVTKSFSNLSRRGGGVLDTLRRLYPR